MTHSHRHIAGKIGNGAGLRRGRCRRCAIFGCLFALSLAANVTQHFVYGDKLIAANLAGGAVVEAANAEAKELLYQLNTEKGRWNDAIDTVIRRKDDAIAAGEWCEAALLIDRYTQLVSQFAQDDPRRLAIFVDMMNKWHDSRKEQMP